TPKSSSTKTNPNPRLHPPSSAGVPARFGARPYRTPTPVPAQCCTRAGLPRRGPPIAPHAAKSYDHPIPPKEPPMAACRVPGPVCQIDNWINVTDGTTAVTATPAPGTVQADADSPGHLLAGVSGKIDGVG